MHQTLSKLQADRNKKRSLLYVSYYRQYHLFCVFDATTQSPLGGVGGCCVSVASLSACHAGLVSFGIRGDSYVVGDITAQDVLDDQNPFQNLISGAGWLVRAGVNHVEASARDGHLDVLLNEIDQGSGGSSDDATTAAVDGDDDAGVAGAAAGVGGDGGRLDDVLVTKLARTAIGHDAEGRLILLQVRARSG